MDERLRPGESVYSPSPLAGEAARPLRRSRGEGDASRAILPLTLTLSRQGRGDLPRRVVKLGGSLLDCDDLADRLQQWLAAQSPAEMLLVVGGGALVETIREQDRRYKLDVEQAHWSCIRAMAIQAELAMARLPGIRPLGSVTALLSTPAAERVLLVEPWRFLRFEEPEFPGRPLPASWDVTSDSIAARVAEVTEATELVLLKSTLPPPGASLAEIAQAGIVDAWFPHAAEKLPCVRLVNLRAAAGEPAEIRCWSSRDEEI